MLWPILLCLSVTYSLLYSRPKNDEKFSLPYVTLVRFHSFVVQGHAKPNIRKSPKISNKINKKHFISLFTRMFENGILLQCETLPCKTKRKIFSMHFHTWRHPFFHTLQEHVEGEKKCCETIYVLNISSLLFSMPSCDEIFPDWKHCGQKLQYC